MINIEWWYTLSISEQILYSVAIPSTLILLIQVIMLLVGFGSAGEGVNFSDTSGLDGDISDVGDIAGEPGEFTDGSAPGDFGIMSLFSLQGIMTFLTVFSWMGIILIGAGVNIPLSFFIAFTAGFLAMFGIAWLIHLSGRLVHNGNLNINILVGEYGTVYLPIPPNGYGYGKVTVQLAERFLECEAMSEDGPIAVNTQIRIVDIRPGNVLVVEKIK